MSERYSLHVETGKTEGTFCQYMTTVDADSAREALETQLGYIAPDAEACKIEVVEIVRA